MTGRLLLVPNTLDLGAEPVPLEDVLARGVLRQAAGLRFWVAEDARSARAFLKRVDAVFPLIQPLQAMHISELPRPRKGSREALPAGAWTELLKPALEGQDVGLISDAGLPAVADPGAALVQAAHAAAVPVVALPGPTSLLLALAASGLNGQSFAFVGYLPQDGARRHARLIELEALSRRNAQTQLAIETPYRNQALLTAMTQSLAPATRLAVTCGLTLEGGWSRSTTVADWRRQAPLMPDRWPAVFSFLAA